MQAEELKISLASCCIKISLVVFEIANPSNGVHGHVGPPLNTEAGVGLSLVLF